MPNPEVDFVDSGSAFDPFNGDVPSYSEVLRSVQLSERIEADRKNHSQSPIEAIEAQDSVSDNIRRDLRENNVSFARKIF